MSPLATRTSSSSMRRGGMTGHPHSRKANRASSIHRSAHRLSSPTPSIFLRISSQVMLRAAWAKIGNAAPVYSLYPTYNLNFSNSSGLLGSLAGNDLPFRGQPGATAGITVYDENLTPEFTTSIELGADLQLLQDRLTLKVTVYD